MKKKKKRINQMTYTCKGHFTIIFMGKGKSSIDQEQLFEK